MTIEPDQKADLIAAIIVTYNPDFKALAQLLDAILPQVHKTIIVDNGSQNDVCSFINNFTNKIIFEPLEQNLGIAKAHNVGIEIARNSNSNYVLLFDQDSLPHSDMVKKLHSAAVEKRKAGIKIACLGVRYEDPRQKNPPPFIKVEGLKLTRHQCNCESEIVEVDYLISSGSLIPIETIDNVGGMREELFIDYVDIEWGLRAQKLGYQSYGVCSAYMQHDLGDNPIIFWGRKIPVHSPLRHYYHFRNAVWLYKQNWLKTNWKIVDGIKLIRKFVFYSLFTENRVDHIRMMLKGIWHGLTNKMGAMKP
ncbi:glycosyltransferase family 2 protein [Pseudochrobactrum sp. B5]|uniref:glycosyltransferase family 2 protein n=1 Tax=Pseudochrobactrum sp. B5 TaxID=1289478 RepID=UPI0009514F1C|nr:glycosyltransferase family 2 protein [Pseudochrobactrum sp. B5]